jgi:MerR family transcriptional regulator/heat shock protein HspR
MVSRAAGAGPGAGAGDEAPAPSAQPVFVISVAAELAGMHPQTLRQYDRLGLVTPARTKGRGRRYSSRDIQRLRDVQRMSQEDGINLAGIQRIMELQRRVEILEAERSSLRIRLARFEERQDRVFAASSSGEVSSLRRGERMWAPDASAQEPSEGAGALVPWDPWEAFNLQAVAAALRMRRSLLNGRMLESRPGTATARIIEGAASDG